MKKGKNTQKCLGAHQHLGVAPKVLSIQFFLTHKVDTENNDGKRCKNTEKVDFDQCTVCKAPICWSQ